jgi:beta-propeller repeat-containing protein
MSQWALYRFSQRGLQTYFALFAFLALAAAGLLAHGGSPSISSGVPALSLPASAPSTQSPPANVPAKAEQRATHAYDKLPLAFVPNRGQTDKRVRYYAQGAGHGFYFTPEKTVLTFTKKEKGVALHLTPVGASPSTRLVAGERAPGKANYLIDSEHHRNLPTYRELAYRNVWPGVDLVFRGQGGTLKYELRVQAGADLSKIGLAYGGADGVSVGKGGNLLIQTPLGTLRDSHPRSYQRIGGKHVPVDSRYAVKHGNAYGFALGSSYDPRHPLVIDPGIEYSTYLGGSGSDRADGVAVDGAGNAYVTGRANSGFPTTAGAFDTSSNGPSGSGDAYVTKLNATGSALEYSTYIGGATGGDSGLAIAIDGTGSAYITGYTGSTDFPTTAGAYDTTYNAASGAANAFVSKLSPDGSALDYSTYLGGFNTSGFFDLGSGIAVDATGAAYVAGDADSTNFPVTPGAFDTTQNGSSDAFVTKLNPAGSALVYSTFVGGTSFDSSTALAVDGSGNAYIAGYGTSTNYPTTPGAFDTSYNQGWDVFVTKLNASGTSLSYSTYLGGATYDEARGITVDGAGSAYVTGHTFSSGYPTTAGAFDTSYDNSVGGSDAFVTKLNASGGALSYSTFLGGSGDDLGEGITVDGSGRAYVTGYTETTNFPTVQATDSTYNGGSFDVFATKLFSTGGSLDFSTYLGGSSDDRGYGIAVNGATGRIYVAGQTDSSGFPTTAGGFDTSYNGGFDAFVTKLPPVGSTLTRSEEPVVVQQSLPDQTGSATGSINVQLPNGLLGIAPGDLVAFRWDGAWEQVPVQVDERDVMDLNRPYTTSRPSCSDPCYSNPPNGGAIHPEFTDPNTFVGPDSDPTLDANDEVALMASDAGGPRTTSYSPAGVDAASAAEVEISDPIDGGHGYVYLFKDTSGLDPAAGKDYVHYQFNLTNGPYKTGAYNPTNTTAGNGMTRGPRPETSSVQTDNYKRGFTDRWYDNELRVLRGGATGVDILDRHDDQFDAADASCVRDQQTFSIGEGAFIVNKDGPVRAIRDFVGANSGPHVQRQHIFYKGLEAINTFLRVHPIPGVVDFFDYSQAGVGLTYKNGVQTPTGIVSGTPPGGVTIDGQPDTVTGAGSSGLPGFESVDGPQGGLTMTQRLLTNNPDPSYHLDYRDGNVTNQALCTGDDNQLYGASGPQLNSAVNNTDEANRSLYGGGQFSNVFYQRDIYYESPGQADGPRRLAEMQAPLDLSVQGVELSEPTGTIVVRKDAVPDHPQDFSFTAGGGLSPTSFQLDDDSDPTLSNTQMFTNVPPGSGYSVSEDTVPSGWEQQSVTCDDGSPPSAIDVSAGETVTCTFTNAKVPDGYARPKAASPSTFKLVPAFEDCGEAANSTHGAPLEAPSCAPAIPTSHYVTVGTPDANGNPARFSGSLVLKAVGESPINPDNGDQADVQITANLNDIRNQGDLSDYTGELRFVLGLRITDRYNGDSLDKPATAADTVFGFDVSCAGTAGPEGSDCNLATTADAITTDIARERQRAIWELSQVQVFDGGADGDADTAGDNTLFAVPGLFAP